MLRRTVVATVSLTLAAVSAARGQASAPDSAALVAGAKAGRVSIDPFPVNFTRGDSMSVHFALLDSIGTELTGARWSLETEGRVVRYRLVDSTASSRRYVFAGDAPGSQTFWVAVDRRARNGDVDHVRIDSVVATVADWQVARMEIAAPEYTAYSGTTLQLRVKVYSKENAEIENPRVSWDTDDPCHARMMPDGAISFGAPAKITVKARSQGKEATREIRVASNPVATVDISPKSAQTRVGDVVRFRVDPSDRRGETVKDISLTYTVTAVDSAKGSAKVDTRGYFVAETPGSYLLRVSAGDVAAEAMIDVAKRPAPTPVEPVGRGAIKDVASRGLAVFTGKDGRDYAYTGGSRGRVYVWDVSDPARVNLTDSVAVDAVSASDIKVGADGGWAVVARTGGSGARNGITVLDLGNPAHPRVQATFSDNLAGGIRRLWVDGGTVYAVDSGAGALDILDVSTPAQPRYVGRWETRPGQIKDLHDVFGDDKNLYLAYGADGLVVLDIGKDGTPTNPKLVTQLKWKDAAAHSVVRAGRYAFVGEAVSGCVECVSGPRGAVRIIDLSKIKEPLEVARYEVPEAAADWLSVENSTLFGGFRQGGVRLVDVTGELRGDLYREGRQVGWFMTGKDTPVEAVDVVTFKGYVYALDANSGLWVLRHQRSSRLNP